MNKAANGLPLWRQFHWVLRVHVQREVQTWRPSFEVAPDTGSGRRLWLVSYFPEEQQDDVVVAEQSLDQVAEALLAVLEQMIALTGKRIPAWQETFAGLRAKLVDGRHAQMLPPVSQDVLPDLPARIVATVSAATVFTGMGNWADNLYGPDIDPTVEKLTASLFSLLAEGLEAAVDATVPQRR